MSLADLAAQAEEGEIKQPEVEEETFELDDPEMAAGEDGEGEAAPEADDDSFELELAGKPESNRQKYDPVEVLEHRLGRERKKRQAAKSETEELRAEIEQLKQSSGRQAQQPAPQPQNTVAAPMVPDMYDSGIDGDRAKYNEAMQQWYRDFNAYENRGSQATKQQDDYTAQTRARTKALAERAAKFSQDNKVSVDRVADALDLATTEIDEATGIEGSLAFLLESVGEGSERVGYHIGTVKGKDELDRIKGLLSKDKTGMSAATYMARMVSRLTPKHSNQISKAPDPDQPLKGDGVTPSSRKLQEAFDKASESSNMVRMRELKKKAEQLGVKLK
jgi:hypothetical protein